MNDDSTKIGGLFYEIQAPNDKLNADLDKSDKKVKEFGENAGVTGEQVRAGFNKAAIGLGAVGATFLVLAKNATDFTKDTVADAKGLAREIGVTTTEASRLTAAFGRVGISTDQARSSFGIFAKNIVAANEAIDKTSTGFGKLGVSIKDAQGKQKTFNELLFEVADKFKQLPDGIDKTALALELFGRSGRDMIKVLNLGSQGIQELEQKADELGLTLNEKTINNINELVKSQKDLKQQTDALKIAIGTATAPILTEFNKGLNDVLSSLLGTDGPMRNITATFIAFGGPVLSGTAAVVAFGANLVQILPAINSVTVALTGLSAVTLVGWSAAAVAAIGAVAFAIYELDKAMNKISKSVDDLSKKPVQVGNTDIKVSGTSDVGLAAQFRRFFGFAEGTDFAPGGWSWVGEKGPELMYVPRGSQVIPSDKSQGMGGINIDMRGATFRDRSDIQYMVALLGRNVELARQGLPSRRGAS